MLINPSIKDYHPRKTISDGAYSAGTSLYILYTSIKLVGMLIRCQILAGSKWDQMNVWEIEWCIRTLKNSNSLSDLCVYYACAVWSYHNFHIIGMCIRSLKLWQKFLILVNMWKHVKYYCSEKRERLITLFNEICWFSSLLRRNLEICVDQTWLGKFDFCRWKTLHRPTCGVKEERHMLRLIVDKRLGPGKMVNLRQNRQFLLITTFWSFLIWFIYFFLTFFPFFPVAVEID